MNLVAGALILVGAIIGGDCGVRVLGPRGRRSSSMIPALVPEEAGWIRPDHFVERHGLVVMVALGESVVAVGIGASGIDVSGELLAVAILGLILSAELWWVYFRGDDERGRGGPARDDADPGGVLRHERRLLLGPPRDAARDRLRSPPGSSGRSATPSTRSDFAQALELGGGTALYLAGHALFRAALGLSFRPWRAVALVLALATIPLGTETSALVQLAVLVAGLGALQRGRWSGLRTEPFVQTSCRPETASAALAHELDVRADRLGAARRLDHHRRPAA